MEEDGSEMENSIDEDFGEVVTRKCSFCYKTYDIRKFFAIPNQGESMQLYTQILNSQISSSVYQTPAKRSKWGIFGTGQTSKKMQKPEPKNVNEGICLKCMMLGIMNIYDNDVNKIKEGFDLMLKKKIAEDLTK